MNVYELEFRRILIEGQRQARLMTPRQQAEAAHCAGGPSVDELEQMVLADRGLGPERSSPPQAA